MSQLTFQDFLSAYMLRQQVGLYYVLDMQMRTKGEREIITEGIIQKEGRTFGKFLHKDNKNVVVTFELAYPRG